ncbi:hypothetical protein Taro_000482 [Colocasia esculenta]|uniref:Uncharacterized protein n=1 Tax=Colocasia esculenta TaxID=4460 RepID=A0A843TFA9_COLES|nr:hypothetical protein [Colocasia esculenta]
MKNWSTSVDTSSSSVDTRDGFQKTWDSVSTLVSTLVSTWDSVSTLDQLVSTLDQLPETCWVKLGQCVDTRSSSVDTSALPEKTYRSRVTRKHVSCRIYLHLL